MKKLMRFMVPYKKEAILAPLFKLLEASLELLIPLLIAGMIDVGIANGSASYVGKTGWTLLGIAVLGLVFAITAQFFAAKASVGFTVRMRKELFEHIESFCFEDLNGINTSDFITAMIHDANQVQAGINLTLRLLLRSPFIVAGSVVMAFVVSPEEGVIFGIAVPLVALFMGLLMKFTIPYYEKIQRAINGLNRHTRESLEGVRVIRAFGREEQEEQEFQNHTRGLYGWQMFVGNIHGVFNPLTFVIMNLAIVALLRTGAIRIQSGHLTQGQMVALINYTAQILVEMGKVVNLVVNVTRAIACGNRIQGMLELQPSQVPKIQRKNEKADVSAEKTSDAKPFLSLDQVSYRYPGAKDDALQDISLSVKKGETVGIIGGTGSGKTTLIHLIAGLYRPTKGDVSLEGRVLQNWEEDSLRSMFALVPQNAVLFSGTVASNLQWGKEQATKKEMEEALKNAMAYEFVMEQEEGLEQRVSQEGKNFSGGQRQRLTIARALIRKAPVLILDDAFSALDYATDGALRQNLNHLEEHPTIFLVSQRTMSVKEADQIVVLEDGNVVGQGTHEELLATCPVYQEIHASQYGDEEIYASRHSDGEKGGRFV